MRAYVQRNTELARGLRIRMTDAEQRLWLHLRRDQLGVRFYRQKPLGPYIVDFFAPKAKLVIEVDGSQHYDDLTQRQKDTSRDVWLNSQWLAVMRFDARQVLVETQAVLEVIFRAVRHAVGGEIPPSPPFAKGGDKPQPSIEGSPPLQKGGQGGIGDASIHDEGVE
jgi:very-short-patch-repair endonuclease